MCENLPPNTNKISYLNISVPGPRFSMCDSISRNCIHLLIPFLCSNKHRSANSASCLKEQPQVKVHHTHGLLVILNLPVVLVQAVDCSVLPQPQEEALVPVLERILQADAIRMTHWPVAAVAPRGLFRHYQSATVVLVKVLLGQTRRTCSIPGMGPGPLRRCEDEARWRWGFRSGSRLRVGDLVLLRDIFPSPPRVSP